LMLALMISVADCFRAHVFGQVPMAKPWPQARHPDNRNDFYLVRL
jgi:hypothetical protein